MKGYDNCPKCNGTKRTKNKQCAKCRGYGLKRGKRSDGYIRIFDPDHPLANSDGQALEHRKILFDSGINIPHGFHVHHKNEDRSDNRIQNLELIDASSHHKNHIYKQGYVENQFGIWPLKNA